METQEKIKTYADVFGELPRNVQYNLRAAVCKTLNIKPSDFYRLLAYRFDETEKHTRGTFFYYFDGLYNSLPYLTELSQQYEAIGLKRSLLKSVIANEREYIAQARAEAIIKDVPNPALYPETYLKPRWNATKTGTVTRHGVTHTQCPRPLNKSGRSIVNTYDGQVMSGASMFFPDIKRSKQIYTAV